MRLRQPVVLLIIILHHQRITGLITTIFLLIPLKNIQTMIILGILFLLRSLQSSILWSILKLKYFPAPSWTQFGLSYNELAQYQFLLYHRSYVTNHKCLSHTLFGHYWDPISHIHTLMLVFVILFAWKVPSHPLLEICRRWDNLY